MAELTMELAAALVSKHVTEPHLLEHALAVSAAMGAMAAHFGADAGYWAAVGYAHDVDYEKWPEEHLQHTRPILEEAGVDEATIRAILAHGWGVCTDVEPVTDLEKSLYTVDSLTGLVSAAAKMRPMGILDLEVSSLKKKFKDKKFAAKIDRALIKQGCEMLGLDMAQVMQICIDGMKPHAEALGIGPKT
ncbi:MAG: hypothetical protein IJX04_03735 [Oscillospiraceae bacterium]|nr:hypothetical protein [Oscillospiraceae bacterium]